MSSEKTSGAANPRQSSSATEAERHIRVRDLFLEVCEHPTDDRQAFLADACGEDAVLRQEIESLLSHHEEDADACPAGATLPTVPDLVSATRPGRRARTRFETGDVFAGRYRIVSELGRGGMGEVLRAHDLVLDEPVAIKLLNRGVPRRSRSHPDSASTATLRRDGRSPERAQLTALLNEVRMARQVTHPNVCRVFDFGEAEGETYLTMEYVDGEDLESLLGRIGRFPRDKLLDVAHQLASGLSAAHAKGVLHRDLKPANILIDGRGKVRITDFGIATTAAPDDQTTGRIGVVAGTPAYMAPEQAARGEVSVQSDLYSVGLVLHEMATGQPVFEAKTPAAYAELHRATEPAPPSQRVQHLDPELESVILKCLEKDPRNRPKSARALAAALPGGDRLRQLLEAGQTPSPEEVAAADRGQTLTLGHAVTLGATLIVLLLGVLAFGDKAYPGREAWIDRAPEVLADRAATIVRELGYKEPPLDRAWGLWPDFDGRHQETGVFWYRQGPEHLRPYYLGALYFPRIDFEDPPPSDEGIRMLLDPSGQLLMLHVTTGDGEEASDGEEEGSKEETADEENPNDGPRASDGEGTSSGSGELNDEDRTPDPSAGELDAEPQPSESDHIDWVPALKAAGFDIADLKPAEPLTTPPVFADRRAAWTAIDRTRPIEAAAAGGRLVYFDAREIVEDEEQPINFNALWSWYLDMKQFIWLLLAAAAIVLAWNNVIARRGDLRGARKLALFAITLNLASWWLEADHIPDLGAVAFRFEATLGRVLFEALIVWLAYIALEPTVRRWWPHALISWNRLLRGQLTDPLVGRSLLTGAVAGTGWVVLTQLDRLITHGLGLEDAGEIFLLDQLEHGLAGRLMAADVFASCVEAVTSSVLDLFFLVALRVVLKRWWLAVAIFVLIGGTFETLEGIHPAVSWLTLGVGIAGGTAFVLLRFGLLTYAASLFCYFVLITAPTTLSFHAWFADTGLFVVLLVAAIGAFGLWASLAKRPLATRLFEDSA